MHHPAKLHTQNLRGNGRTDFNHEIQAHRQTVRLTNKITGGGYGYIQRRRCGNGYTNEGK